MDLYSSRLLRYLQRFRRLPGKLPGSLYLDAAQSGWIVGESLAHHQLTVGFLGQTGIGGSPFVPESVDLEYEFIRGSRLF